jgi:ribonuclease J
LNDESVRLLPLGGLGEIGKNMTVVEHGGRIVLVDTGLMFPTAEMLGIDLVLPDFSYLRDRADDIEAIVLTHGHEDHVGALPYVLREIGLPPVIYGGPLTIGLVRSKLEEHRIRDAPLEVLEVGERVDAGPFVLELIHMSHSIPHSRAVAIETGLGTVLATGDYKFDQTPVDGVAADVSRLAELGREGVLCLFGDSTNADRPGVAPSESSVGPALLETFSRCEGRIIVTCFASNVHRVQQAIDAAAVLDRRVALVGRSMRKNFNIASNLGIAQAPDGLLIQPKEIEDFPDHKVIAISTGSQGEPLSALRRMAFNDHRDVELHSGDTVVFSATPIPGNERSVNETIDRIFEIGAEVVTAADAPIHASGHGWQEELKLMLNLTKPRYVLPAHGDHRRLRLHADLAEAVGIDPDRIFRGRNGVALEIDRGGAQLRERTEAGMIFVDGVDIGDPDDVALRDRRTLSADGVFIVVVTVSGEDGTSVADPELIFRGVPFLDDASVELLGELRDVVERSLEVASEEGVTEPVLVQEDLHDDLAKFVYERLKRRPMILPVVVEV